MARKVLSCRPRTTPPRDRSAEVRTELNAIEARRVARAAEKIEAAVSLALRETRNPRMIADPKIRAVDRLMQRWAIGHGSGLPVEDPGALAARLPPLDDATQIVIDRVITHDIPDTVRKLVCAWYRTQAPTALIARDRGISVRTVYRHWELSLEYLRELFIASNHSDLLRMLNSAV